tara:strand:- start:6431 stop:7195 length:765 start_codon:yes stop_codon:yes gene_type:complete
MEATNAEVVPIVKKKIVIDDYDEIHYNNGYSQQYVKAITKRVNIVLIDNGDYARDFDEIILQEFMASQAVLKTEMEQMDKFSAALLKDNGSLFTNFVKSIFQDDVLTTEVHVEFLELFKYDYLFVVSKYNSLYKALVEVRKVMPDANLQLSSLLHLVKGESLDDKLLIKQIAHAEKNDHENINAELTYQDDNSLDDVKVDGSEAEDYFASFHMQMLTMLCLFCFLIGFGFVLNYEKMMGLVDLAYSLYIKAPNS